MGSESKGLRELVKNNCDMTAKINIKRSIESLNVSVALAITLYEINRT
jgi:23S rRNA (guanosine2251-2'-O)-methyltransferase